MLTQIDSNIEIMADKYTMSTVFTNLINNVIKFTGTGGQITIPTHITDNHCLINVSDTGLRIPKDDLHRLFKITENYTTPGTEHEKGTGFGLILCKEFVELNSGSITVESQKGKGTTFTISLPHE